jgi:hypothetical protein
LFPLFQGTDNVDAIDATTATVEVARRHGLETRKRKLYQFPCPLATSQFLNEELCFAFDTELHQLGLTCTKKDEI